MANKTYTPEFVAKFLELYDAGVSEKEIRKLLDLSSSGVQRLREYAKGDRFKPYRTIQKATSYSAMWGMYSTYKRGAKIRNLDFSISFEYFEAIIKQPCVYCGCIGTKRIHGSYHFFGNGVDRIDNNLGYTFENSTTACSTCNMMKKTMSVQEYITHCAKVVRYNAQT